jgi:hypothetical protein
MWHFLLEKENRHLYYVNANVVFSIEKTNIKMMLGSIFRKSSSTLRHFLLKNKHFNDVEFSIHKYDMSYFLFIKLTCITSLCK